jgi:GntR family transcriptional regulator
MTRSASRLAVQRTYPGERVKQPAYKTLAGELRGQIESGVWPPTRRLPTDAQLGKEFGVSRQTVRHAFEELVGEGLVYRVPGRGSFAVASPPGLKYLRSLGSIEDLMSLAVDTELEVLEPFRTVVDVAAAGRLRFPSDRVSRAVFRRLHDAVPYCVTTMYLTPELGEQIAADPRIARAGVISRATVIGILEETAGQRVAGTHQSLSAALADAQTAELIGCAQGDAVLTVDRMYFDVEGRFFELAVSSFNVARYSYRIELRRGSR